MKKIFMAIAAMTMLIATSCKESANAPEDLVPGDGEFLVTIANAPRQEAPTNGKTVKTYINDNDIIWQNDDEISINGVTYKTNTSGSPVIFQSKDGTPAIVDEDGKYKAYYPVEIAPTADAAGELPNTIPYNGNDLKNLPMYAESDNNVLTFHNICAALKITVPNLDEGVTCDKIVISANENLAGKFSIGYDATSAPMAVLSDDAVGMSNTITVNGTFTADAPVYVALPAGTYNNFTVKFNSGNEVLRHRTLSKPLTLNVNNLYNLLSFDASVRNDEFCFIAKEDGCTLKLNQYGSAHVCSFEYYNATMQSWSSYTPGNDITLNVGDKVYFRAGTNGNNKLATINEYHYFSSTGKVAVSGNVMYLLDRDGNQQDLTTNNDYAFCSLFKNMALLEDASGLILPATNLASYCYEGMFQNCSTLTAAPNLPAETLAVHCYENMFYGCTALTAAPSLPAKTLSIYCYQNMFYGCTALTAAPSLPAKTLLIYCYDGMFQGCTALTAAPDLLANKLSNYCYRNMFNGCSSLGVCDDEETAPSGAKILVVPDFEGTGPLHWGDGMFSGTGGYYTGNPVKNTTYYLYDATQH